MGTNLNPEQNRSKSRHARGARGLGLTGPILLISLGIMFLIGQFVPEWGVGKTWPVILIVIGLAKLLESAWGARST